VPLAEEATGRTGTNFFARLLRGGVDPFVMADRAAGGRPPADSGSWPWPPTPSCAAAIRPAVAPAALRQPSPVTHAQPGDKTLTAATGIEEIGRQTTDLATADFPSPIKVAATGIRWPGSAELFR
jgi:hypothetical protein